jgi:Protein of unknown function (Hypoth_ymh)
MGHAERPAVLQSGRKKAKVLLRRSQFRRPRKVTPRSEPFRQVCEPPAPELKQLVESRFYQPAANVGVPARFRHSEVSSSPTNETVRRQAPKISCANFSAGWRDTSVTFHKELQMDIESRIDDRLWQAVESPYPSRDYRTAILDSIHFIGQLVRDKAGLESDGAVLAGEAFWWRHSQTSGKQPPNGIGQERSKRFCIPFQRVVSSHTKPTKP